MNLNEVNWKSDLRDCAGCVCPLEGPKYNEFGLIFPGEDSYHVRMCGECARRFVRWMIEKGGEVGSE